MHVLLLTDGVFPFETGGMQKHSYYLCKYLLKQGHSVCLVHSVKKVNANNPHPPISEILEVKEQNKLKEIKIIFPSGVKFPGHYLYNSYRYSKLAFKAVESNLNSFDHIYIQGFSGWYFLDRLKGISKSTKIITNFHGLEMFQLNVGVKAKMQSFLLRFFAKKLLQRSPYVHSLGGKLTNILQNNVGVPVNRIIVAPIGIEKKWIRTTPPEEQKCVLNLVFIGRNEPRKGFPLLKKVTQKIDSTKMHLHVIGPFQGSNTDNITYHGLIHNENEIMKIMDQCQVLISPSFAEGMPTVILEAMSRGCAIAATDVGAVSEEVDDMNGWLFIPADEESIKNCLATILKTENAVLLEKQKVSILKIENKFLWDELIRQIFY